MMVALISVDNDIYFVSKLEYWWLALAETNLVLQETRVCTAAVNFVSVGGMKCAKILTFFVRAFYQ